MMETYDLRLQLSVFFPVNFYLFLRLSANGNLVKRYTFTNLYPYCKKYANVKIYKYITSVPNFFLFPRNISSIPGLLPRTVWRKEPKEPSAKKSFSFLIISYLKSDIVNFIYVTECFPSNLVIPIATKIMIWVSFSISYLLQFLQIFISSWILYHLVLFITKL